MISPDLLSIATDTAHVYIGKIYLGPFPRRNERLIPEGMEKITLRHHKGAFVGCFSLRLKKNIDWGLFKLWKEKRTPSITDQIARDFLPFIRNHYDYITTAPPSAKRTPIRYCVYDLGKTISKFTVFPFVPAYLPQAGIQPENGQRCIIAGSPVSASQSLNSWNPGTPVCRAAHSTGRSKTAPSSLWTIA